MRTRILSFALCLFQFCSISYSQCFPNECFSVPTVTQSSDDTTLLEVTLDKVFENIHIVFWDKDDKPYESQSLGTKRLFSFENLKKNNEYYFMIQCANYTMWVKLIGGYYHKLHLSPQIMFDANKDTDILKVAPIENNVKNYGLDIIRMKQDRESGRKFDLSLHDLDWKKENNKLTIVIVGNESLQDEFRKHLNQQKTIYDKYFRIQYFKPSDWQINYKTDNGSVRLPDGLTVFSPRNEDGKAYILHHQNDTQQIEEGLLGALRKVDPKLAEEMEKELPDVRKPKPKPEPSPTPQTPEVNYEYYVVGGSIFCQLFAFLAIVWKALKEKLLR